MSKPHLPKTFLDQLYKMDILDPEQDPLKQFQETQDLQRLYESGNAPPASTQEPHLNKSQATTTPSSSPTDSKQSTQDPVRTLFADRARRLEKDKKEKEATEKTQKKDKALARKEATSLQPDAAMSMQARYAEEERERLHEEKMARERVLKRIEDDKVERKEKEERRKETARADADEASRRSKSDQINAARAADTISPRSIPSRPPRSQVSSGDRALPARNYTADVPREGYSYEEYTDDQGYAPKHNNSKSQNSSQRFRSPLHFATEDIPADQRHPSFPNSRSTSSHPFSSSGIKLGGPRNALDSSRQQPSFPSNRPRQQDRSSPHAGPHSSSRSPRAPPKRKTIERFSDHECVWRDPHSSSHFTTSHEHPFGDNECSHCDQGFTSDLIICHPCVVRGCRGQWCYDCWDTMVGRKRGGVTRPPGWQVCEYRRRDRKGRRGGR